MATLTTNLSITKIATGDETGTWGNTTNANWDIVDGIFETGGTAVSMGAITPDSVNIASANGLDVSPGSDIDADLITVGVTGTPRLWWDESADRFVATKGVESTNFRATATSLGFAVYPGSDTNCDLVFVGVTGAPKMYWNEASDWFNLTKGLDIGGDATIQGDIDHRGSELAFFNKITKSTKLTVTGSAGGNAALASLLTALDTYGLITDSSS